MRQCHYIMIKRSSHQKDKTIINIYIPNIKAPKYVKQTLMDLKEEVGKIIVWEFNTPLSTMIRSRRQKISKKTLDLNHTLD